MRITFSNEKAAQAAVRILGQYGYSATPAGPAVMTDCPPLLALPTVHRSIGFEQVETLHLAEGSLPEPAPPRASPALS
jgi:hypothetical protein